MRYNPETGKFERDKEDEREERKNAKQEIKDEIKAKENQQVQELLDWLNEHKPCQKAVTRAVAIYKASAGLA